jgi:predicted N-formylglutamate amidohydrolase
MGPRRIRQAIVVSCEHGGPTVPARYRALFAAHRAALESHRGYDRGALAMARALAAAFNAPLAVTTTTRLLIDANRSIGHPQLYSSITRNASAALRKDMFDQHYLPHRARVERLVMRSIAKGRETLHLACHSFTPRIDGVERSVDVGLLYDPARAEEVALCVAWQRHLRILAPALRVRRNYPYLGKTDGFTTWFRRRHPGGVYLGIELELNQATMVAARFRSRRAQVIEALARALAER